MVVRLTLQSVGLTSLEGKSWPAGLRWLNLGENHIESLSGLPPGLTWVSLGMNRITSLEGLPASVKHLALGVNPIASLAGLPPGLKQLSLREFAFPISSSRPVPCLRMGYRSPHATLDLDPVFTATYCGTLTSFSSSLYDDEEAMGSIFVDRVDEIRLEVYQELRRAVQVPLKKRPARVVLVVLSSSSVPRVGLKAAVRRLHRADLVREMAGMLG